NTSRNAPFSLFAYGDVSHGRNKFEIKVPDGLSILATDSPSGTVQGINDVQAAEQAKYGPGHYIPIVGLAYWSFRLMIGFGVLAGLLALVLVVQWRRGKIDESRRLLGLAAWAIVLPTLANTFGWIFTETARQPWLVYGVLTTRAGVSTNVSNAMVLATLIGFTALYGVLAVVAVRLFVRLARKGPDPVDDTPPDAETSDAGVLSLVY
ncbi:MAG TPA: cytochrome ubiquinol oxidase subunit I, partial [Acidimicrobiales bacterium]|nr:cytochrome ubiquinol oxidase subunit I [Acidimicrobiales bacterium]